MMLVYDKKKEGKLRAYVMKRVAAGADLPTPWLFAPAKRPDDRDDYCLNCSLPPPVQAPGTRFYTWVDWDVPMGE